MLCRLALADDDFAGGELECLASLDTRTIVIGQVHKERQPPERTERRCGVRSHTRLRYWWINSMAIEPSPTAEATRLIEPWRTSPATKMPRYVCFEQIGLAFERPVARTTAINRKIGAGENVTTLVIFNQICDTGGVRPCADKNEKSHRRRGCCLPRLVVRDGDTFEVVFAVCLDHARLQLHHNI